MTASALPDDALAATISGKRQPQSGGESSMGLVRALLAGLIAVLLAGCGGGTSGPAHYYESGSVIHAETVSGSDPALPSDAASMQRITYVSRSGVDDSNPHVTGSV